MFLDGYRDILEYLVGGVVHPSFAGQPSHQQPQYQGTSQSYVTPNSTIRGAGFTLGSTTGPSQAQQPSYSGRGRTLGNSAGSSQPPPPPTRRFQYSFTTYGPDGSVHHVSNDPNSTPSIPGGRQIPVPTLQDFLGWHNVMGPYTGTTPGGYVDPHAAAAMMTLQNLLGAIPMHGNTGDYMRPVIPAPSYK